MCTDCKARWGKFVISDFELYNINWIELNYNPHDAAGRTQPWLITETGMALLFLITTTLIPVINVKSRGGGGESVFFYFLNDAQGPFRDCCITGDGKHTHCNGQIAVTRLITRTAVGLTHSHQVKIINKWGGDQINANAHVWMCAQNNHRTESSFHTHVFWQVGALRVDIVPVEKESESECIRRDGGWQELSWERGGDYRASKSVTGPSSSSPEALGISLEGVLH